ncbi:MAG TPA: hypothetical protein VFQ34_12050 [Nitrospiraceae bacterium]|nr:hypothetical protein [Nitrospiraceae bacterium]
MKMLVLSCAALLLWLSTVLPSHSYETIMVFPMSSVLDVDRNNQQLTFKTREGQLWTLRVADPAAMNNVTLAKGDIVIIEVDVDDRIVKIQKDTGSAGKSGTTQE